MDPYHLVSQLYFFLLFILVISLVGDIETTGISLFLLYYDGIFANKRTAIIQSLVSVLSFSIISVIFIFLIKSVGFIIEQPFYGICTLYYCILQKCYTLYCYNHHTSKVHPDLRTYSISLFDCRIFLPDHEDIQL